LTTLTVIVVGSLLHTGKAEAANATCDFPIPASHFHAGWTTASTEPHRYEGVSAVLQYQQSALCHSGDPTYTNMATAYTMIKGADGNGWAQSGLWFQADWSCWKHYWQYEDNYSVYGFASGHFQMKTGVCVSSGEIHHSWQQSVYDGVNWHMRTIIDSTYYDTPWSQFAAWASPFGVEFSGETTHNNSDVPGYTSNKSDFAPPGQDIMRVQDFYDDTFYDTCQSGRIVLWAFSNWSVNDPMGRYSTDAPACNHVRVWTH